MSQNRCFLVRVITGWIGCPVNIFTHLINSLKTINVMEIHDHHNYIRDHYHYNDNINDQGSCIHYPVSFLVELFNLTRLR